MDVTAEILTNPQTLQRCNILNTPTCSSCS